MFNSTQLLLIALFASSVTSLVRRGSGVVLVKISNIQNPEGRDAAGSCCNGAVENVDDDVGVCSGNCYSMLKICASQVKNDSVLLQMYKDYQSQQKVQDTFSDREDSQGRVTNKNKPEKSNQNHVDKTRLPPKLNPQNNYRPPIRIKPQQQKEKVHSKPVPNRQRRPPKPPPPVKKPTFPFGPLPNIFRSRSSPPMSRSGHVAARDQEPEMRVWEPEEFTVMWRDGRNGKMLLGDDVSCRYGAINTDVIFNNSLGGRQRDLLIKLPFEEAWPGMFELTVEIWHNANPAKIPQLQVQSKKQDDKSILATIFDTLATQLTKTVNDFETKRSKDKTEKGVGGEALVNVTNTDIKDNNQTGEIETTTLPDVEDEVTPASLNVSERILTKVDTEESEETKLDIKEEEVKKNKLILRLEKEHMIYAGDDWQSSSYTNYHSNIQYSVKLACGKDFTGPTCSFARLCLNPNVKKHPRLVCTKEGEIVCRPGWDGAMCDRPLCAPGCDPDHGYCDKPGECKCKVGYHGPMCDQCDKLLGCSRHGYCNKAFECRCQPGWAGLFCTEPVCGEGCDGTRGYCNKPGECRCRQGWQGPACDQCVPAPGCDHGGCQLPGECTCDQGWRGGQCDLPDCGEDCDPDHGYCDTPGQCRCRLGWQGARCDTCVPYPGCVNGQCRDTEWQCHCQAGWTGHKCDQIETEEFGDGVRDGRCQSGQSFLCMNGGVDVCSWTGNGTMVDHPRCKCPPGFSGKYCQDSLNRDSETVFSVLPKIQNVTQLEILETIQDEVFPAKLDNSLEKL